MPDLATMQAATPRCQALNPPRNLKEPGTVCDRPLIWKQRHEAWTCTTHGYSGYRALAERDRALAERDETAA